VHIVDQHYALMSAPEAGAQIGAIIQALKQGGRRVLRSAEARAKARHVPCTSVLLETMSGPAAELIVRQAKKWRADLIVLGTHGRRGVSRLLMGSDAEQIVRTSPVPVMLVRGKKR